MRIGYSYWGFLGDHKLGPSGDPVSTPDGNATYSWSVIWEAQQRGHQVYMMQQDRDAVGWRMKADDNFAAFSQEKRTDAYMRMIPTDGVRFPELDVLILEWRFRIPGRNCTPTDRTVVGTQGGYEQPDLDRQNELLRYYKERGTKIIIWDLDHKLLPLEEAYWQPDAIFETSVEPREVSMKRTRIEPPTVIDDLLQHETVAANPLRKLVYVGSRYERDDIITQYVKPVSDFYPGQVEFWGNWLNSLEECRKLWPNVSFNERITTKDFRRVYADAVACPLLAKRSYIETGFITPRPWEAVLFGTIPVGISQMRGIRQYTMFSAPSGSKMIDLCYELSQLTLRERHVLREESAHRLRFMDAARFLDRVEGVVDSAVSDMVPEEHNG